MPGSAAMQATLSSRDFSIRGFDTTKKPLLLKCSVTLSENSACVRQRLRCNQYSLGILEGYFIRTKGHCARDI